MASQFITLKARMPRMPFYGVVYGQYDMTDPENPKLMYVGSTFYGTTRMRTHGRSFAGKNKVVQPHHPILREKFNAGLIAVRVLEHVPATMSDTERLLREQYWYDELKPPHGRRPMRTKEDIKNDNKRKYAKRREAERVKHKAYYHANKEALRAKDAEYREKNKEAILARARARYAANRELFLERKRKWRRENPEKHAAQQKVYQRRHAAKKKAEKLKKL